MYTLRDFKNDLFQINAPIVTGIARPNDDQFLDLFFSSSFRTGLFTCTDGKTYSLNPLIGNTTGARTQTSFVFNGNYTGYKLVDAIPQILQSYPGEWDAIFSKCRKVSEASDADRLLEYLRNVSGEISEKYKNTFSVWGKESLPTMLSITVVSLLLQCDKTAIDYLFFREGNLLQQYDYLDNCILHMDRPYHLPTDMSKDAICSAYRDYSDLLSLVSRVQAHSGEVKFGQLFDFLYEAIKTCGDTQKVIRITGPAGSEKNAITQFLFLRMAQEMRDGTEKLYAPEYINLNYIMENFDIEDRAPALQNYLSPFFQFCVEHHEKEPVFFVDGIKNYELGHENLDYALKRLIKGQNFTNAHFIIATENNALHNSNRQHASANFVAGRYLYDVLIDPIYLGDRGINKYLHTFQRIHGVEKNDELFNKLLELNLEKIDTCQLQIIFPFLGIAQNISYLYDAVCLNYLDGNTEEFDVAARWAFNFAYTGEKLPEISKPMRRLLCTHESFLEYFIARWYISKIQNSRDDDNVGLLDMVLPKGITRFVVPMLNSSSSTESVLLDMIRRNYSNMGLLAKSEMTYWLGRIRNRDMEQQAEKMLLEYYEEQKKAVALFSDTSTREYKHCQFLLRGISVSLIVKERYDISDEYLELLVKNDAANEINRGFHLEYYGDKQYLPTISALDFEDVLSSGERTLNQLLSTNEAWITTESLPAIFELNLFTICSLLQVRIENGWAQTKEVFDHFVRRADSLLRHYLSHNVRVRSKVVVDYFKMILHDFSIFLNDCRQWQPVGASLYSQYNKRIKRTGWITRKIPEPETVAEHTFSMWLMGQFLLPNRTDNPDYCKADVLDMILIHDVAEAITGDVEKPEKEKNLEFFESQEYRAMTNALLKGTYREIPNQERLYRLWQEWSNGRTINARIAKDIDRIQALYQLLSYVDEYPDNFDHDDLAEWMTAKYSMQSSLGKKLLHTLILDNPEFVKILENL